MSTGEVESLHLPLRARAQGVAQWAAIVLGLAFWAVLPLFLSRGSIDLLVFAALYAIAGLGVAFLLGQCGIVSLAQSAFYGIGAYATGYCTTSLGWHWTGGLALGVLVSGTTAFLIGWPVLRLSGHFLALATLALATIAHVLFLEWDWLTGGTLGIGGIPSISVFGFPLNTPQRFYYFIWPIALLIFILHRNLLRSRNGLAMRAMRDASAAASVIGVDVHVLKTKVFVLGAVVGSISGSLFANYVSFVSVDSFGVDRAVNFLLLAVVGGVKTVSGAMLGALFVTFVPNFIDRLGETHAMIFAVVLILAVIFLPQGLGGLVENWLRRAFREG